MRGQRTKLLSARIIRRGIPRPTYPQVALEGVYVFVSAAVVVHHRQKIAEVEKLILPKDWQIAFPAENAFVDAVATADVFEPALLKIFSRHENETDARGGEKVLEQAEEVVEIWPSIPGR